MRYSNKVVTRLLGRMGRKHTRYYGHGGRGLTLGHTTIILRYGAYKTRHPRTKQIGWVPFVVEVDSRSPYHLPDYNYMLSDATKVEAFSHAKQEADEEAMRYIGDYNVLVRKTERKPAKKSDGTWR